MTSKPRATANPMAPDGGRSGRRWPERRPMRRLPLPVPRPAIPCRMLGLSAATPPNRALGAGNCTSRGFGTALALLSLEEINDVFENIFGIHEQALLLHGQRIGVLATNLANADTPGYKARDIDFSAVLAHTDDSTTLPMQITQGGHIALSDSESPSFDLKYRNPYQASLDGNTVEMPVEQAAFSENNVRYQASLMFINRNIAELQFAIAGQ
jgi:flagellar basal-body rod protein FlgB